VGSANGQSILVIPDKPNISIKYTNAAQGTGYINDPFFFTNMKLQYTSASSALFMSSEEFGAAVGTASPTTSSSTSSNLDSSNNEENAAVAVDVTSVTNSVTLNVNEIMQQQVSLDTQLSKALTVGYF
jgi:hypothetical protein